MTLIIGFGNSQQFVMAGDRRFTNWDGSGFSDENIKIASFTCSNARMAVAFAGLARAPGFETATWILDTLLEVAKPDYDAENTLQRFCDRATHDFVSLSGDSRYLRTTFLFGGFYGTNPPRPCFARISNYEHDKGSAPLAVASERFSLFKLIQTRFTQSEPTLMVTAGNPAGLNVARVEELHLMSEGCKPARAMVDKAVAIIREAADNFRSGGGVGKQISTVVIPRDSGQPIGSDYDTAVPTDKAFMVNGIVALPSTSIAFQDAMFEKVSDGTNPSRPAFMPRNSRCFCGSGKKYKRCHGAPQKATR